MSHLQPVISILTVYIAVALCYAIRRWAFRKIPSGIEVFTYLAVACIVNVVVVYGLG
jgi:hypothetical protein